MATIGRRSAVMELPHRMRIRGTIAWVAWLALHLVTLIGNRNRLSALVNLAYPRRDEAHQRHAQQRGIKDLGLVVLSERAHAFQQRLAEAQEHATRELASRRHSSRSLPFSPRGGAYRMASYGAALALSFLTAGSFP